MTVSFVLKSSVLNMIYSCLPIMILTLKVRLAEIVFVTNGVMRKFNVELKKIAFRHSPTVYTRVEKNHLAFNQINKFKLQSHYSYHLGQ